MVGVFSFEFSAGCELRYPAGFLWTKNYLEWIMSNNGM